MNLAVLIPTHNRSDTLRETLSTLSEQSAGHDIQFVVICDNCSDNTESMLTRDFPKVIRLSSVSNLWWSESINRGLRALRAERYLLWNDDVVPGEGYFQELVLRAQRHPEAIIGSGIYDRSNPGKAWCLGGRANWLGRGIWMQKDAGNEEFYSVEWLPGMGSLIPEGVFQRLGGLDSTSFPQYFGDTDFFLRAHRSGIPMFCCPRARGLQPGRIDRPLLPSGTESATNLLKLLTLAALSLKHFHPHTVPGPSLSVAADSGPLAGFLCTVGSANAQKSSSTRVWAKATTLAR